jgi:hypothetical protein
MNSHLRFLVRLSVTVLELAIGTVALTAPATSLQSMDTPERWDAAVFMPPTMFNSILNSVAGSSVVIPIDNAPDVRITLIRAATKFDYDTGSVQIEISAAPAIDGPSVTLTSDATLRFAGFDRGNNDDTPQAKFTVTVDSIKPAAKAGIITIAGGNLIANLVKAGVSDFLSKWLSFAVPVPLDIYGETGFDDDLPFTAKSGKVLLHVKAPDVRISKKLTDMQAVFVPAGVWLCAEYNGVKPPGLSAVEQSPPAERLKLYQDNGKVGTPSVLVRGGFVESMINELATLPDRTIIVSGQAHQGNLVEGDTTVWLYNDEEHGTLTITPSATWTKDGLRVTCNYAAEAHAPIAFNFKIPGTSVGSKVRCDTNSAGKIEGDLHSSLVTRSEPSLTKKQASAVILMPTFENGQEVKAKVETDGTFKTKLPFGAWFKTASPKVTVEANLPVPPDILPNLTLLTNEPHSINTAGSLELPKGWKLIPPKAGFPTHIVLEPQKAAWGERSYLLEFNVTLDKLTPEEAQARKAVLEHLLAPNARPALKLGQITVSVAGIGPNNDVVKALIALAKGVADAYQEAKKAGENVEATIAKANEDISRQVNRSANDVAREFDRAERNAQRETGKGIQNTVQTLGKAFNDAGKGIAVFGDRVLVGPTKKLGNAVGKATSGLRKAANRATGGLIR